MNENKRNVLCVFKSLSDESKKIFLDSLVDERLSVCFESNQEDCNIDMICTFSCLDYYLRCLLGQRSLYIPSPAIKGIRVEALCNDEKCIWCTGYGVYANSLIKIDKESMNLQILPMPYETIKKERLFVSILRVDNRIYLVPENSKFIGIFNVLDEKWEKVDITDEIEDGEYYSSAIAVDGYVYFMPNRAKNIIRIDCRNNSKEIIPINLSKDSILYNERYEFCGVDAILAIGKDIYFYSRTYNSFMRFDTGSHSVEVVRRLVDNDFSLACVADGYIFWMFTMSGESKIVKYDVKKDEIAYINNIPKIEYNRVPFYRGTKSGNKIVFVPGVAEKAIMFDTVTSEINVVEELNIESYEKGKENWIYSCIDGDEENIYLFETIVNKFVKFNIKKKYIEKKELFVPKDEWYEWQAKKALQMALQNIEPLNLSGEGVIEEY